LPTVDKAGSIAFYRSERILGVVMGGYEDESFETSTAYGWDPDYSWSAAFDIPADYDWAAAYATIDTDALLQLLPRIPVNGIRRVHPQP
jgi:hypothetical protein